MADSDDLFSHINSAILDLQASGLQNFHRPIKRLAQLLHSPDLHAVNEQLTAKVDLDAFLQASHQTGGSMLGSHKLLWPDDIQEQLGIFLGIVDKLAADENYVIGFAHQFFYSGSEVIAGIHAMTRDLIIPFTREYKRYVLSGGQSIGRFVIPSSNKVFIVHGHDEAALQGLARFLEKLGLEAIVLMEQPNKGLTITEKFEDSADEVGFAVVLLTPDDVGGIAAQDSQSTRARQNVIRSNLIRV
jgi:Predicted nucleotide-binding protein containing TIR-like domain